MTRNLPTGKAGGQRVTMVSRYHRQLEALFRLEEAAENYTGMTGFIPPFMALTLQDRTTPKTTGERLLPDCLEPHKYLVNEKVRVVSMGFSYYLHSRV